MSGHLSSDNRGNQLEQSLEGADLGSSVGQAARIESGKEMLLKQGFTVEQIEKIQEKVSDLDIKVIKPMAGQNISSTAESAAELRDQTGKPVAFKFNGRIMVVGLEDTAGSVTQAFMGEIEAAQKAYWTPERIAEKKSEEAAFKAEMDQACDNLPPFLKDWVVNNANRNYGKHLDTGIAKDAQLVADALKTPDAIEAWYKLGYEEQMEKVPGISDGHSGFSFGQMANLAVQYLKSQEQEAAS